MVEWNITQEPVNYEEALKLMNERVAGIHNGRADELVWLLEHPSLYTAGTSAKTDDLLCSKFPVYEAGRGGQYTYHGPGQRIGYVMLNLKKRQQAPDIKRYVWQLEEWIMRTLSTFEIKGERRKGRIGIWVETSKGEEKIAALGVRVRHWITLHGISINVNPDLSHFEGIVPCGISEYGVTSMKALLGYDVPMADIDKALRAAWEEIF